MSSNARPKYNQCPSDVQIAGDGLFVRRKPDETPYERAVRCLNDNFPGVLFRLPTKGESGSRLGRTCVRGLVASAHQNHCL